MDTPAERAIRDEIARTGPITFSRFMELALYSAPGCYYGSAGEKIGPEGDYFTSPVVHPTFGALIARQIEQVWMAMGRPGSFTVVEMGAGTGALARDLLAYTSRWSPHFHKALSYILTERGEPGLQRLADPIPGPSPTGGRERGGVGVPARGGSRAQRLAGFGVSPKTHITSDTHPIGGPVDGCFLSNELLDSFPIHRLAVERGSLKEVYVEVRNGKLGETLLDLSTPALAGYFDRLGLLPPEDCRAEVNLAALDWMARVARALRRGVVLTLDYGYPAEELFSRRHCDGTLLCYYRHTLNADPYSRIGLQDMTAHVDFTGLMAVGLEHGLRPLGLASQRSFLSRLGMPEYLDHLPRMGLRLRDYEANRAGMLELLKPEGLGRIGVLLQQKGLDAFEPAGLRPEGLYPHALGRDLAAEPPPLLGPSHMRLTAPPTSEPLVDAEGMWKELFGEEDQG